MTPDILSKIAAHLKKPIRSEASVVYLLAQVRKVLDKERPDPKPFALWLHCHWALHVELTDPRTTKEILERVDAFTMDTVSGFEGTGRLSLVESHNLFKDLVSLNGFRSQLEHFLKAHSISTALCTSNNRWAGFISNYMKVIEDGELSTARDKKYKLTAIEKLVFRIDNHRTRPSKQPFSMQWDIVLKDGRILQFELDANQDLSMMSHGGNLIAAPQSPGVS